jgi:ABC-type transport system involved in multi-copper enzyme maturation permease subunit
MRRAFGVARADFLQRIRSRRLLVVIAGVVYLGYLVNVGSIELAYQQPIEGTDDFQTYYGEPTAGFIGLKAAVTGSFVVFLAGFYLLKGTLSRDRSLGISRLVASTPVSDLEYLVGKWLSHVALVCVLLGTLGLATLINHAVNGVGPTAPGTILIPIFLFGVPLGALVGAIAVLFEASDWFDGTLGNIAYFFLSLFVFVGFLAGAQDQLPNDIPLAVKMGDFLGILTVYEMTAGALMDVVPTYPGGPPSFGQVWTDSTSTYRYTGSPFPVWMYGQRLGLIILGVLIAALASVTYDRSTSSVPETSGVATRLLDRLPFLGDETTTTTDSNPNEISLTEADDQATASILKLTLLELRMALRGQRWWWYLGAIVLIAAGPLGGAIPLHPYVSIAAVWPLFVWSSMGVRPFRHQTTEFILSSANPYRQLISEWLSGLIVTLVIVGPAVISTGLHTQSISTVTGVALFVPSVALASGLWSGSSTVFELLYLILWYVGPVNQVPQLDFAGATADAAEMGTPLMFAVAGLVALSAATIHRYRAIRFEAMSPL